MYQRLEMSETGLFEIARAAFEVDDHFDDKVMLQFAAHEFVGHNVQIEPVDQDNRPISAYFYATPYPAFGTQGYRLQHGVFTQPHPTKAKGAIQEINLDDSTLKLRPSRWSLYRASKGYFEVKLLDDQQQPLVKVEFLETQESHPLTSLFI